MSDLTGRAAVNMAVAEAMGWRHIEAQTRYPADAGNYAGAMATIAKWYRVRPDGGLEESAECPDYLSDDPALNAEMWKALPRTGKGWHYGILECQTDDPAWVRPFSIEGFCPDARVNFDVEGRPCGGTLAAALVRALAAAEVVTLPEKEKDDEQG